MKMHFGMWLALCLCAGSVLAGEATNSLERAFPPADKGMVRYVLHLPKQADESVCQVELLVGRMVETDGVNRYYFVGEIIALQDFEHWWCSRYLARPGQLSQTQKLAPLNTPKVNKFVAIEYSDYHLLRYSSSSAVVVYVPEGFEVRYRIWRADPEVKPMDKG